MEAETEVTTGTFDENEGYISEYGLSDEIIDTSEGELSSELPEPAGDDGFLGNSDMNLISENNPNDLDEFEDEADEL
jgi:hypothetical protein